MEWPVVQRERAQLQLPPRVACKMYVKFYNLSAQILITLVTLFLEKKLDLTKHNILIGVTGSLARWRGGDIALFCAPP